MVSAARTATRAIEGETEGPAQVSIPLIICTERSKLTTYSIWYETRCLSVPGKSGKRSRWSLPRSGLFLYNRAGRQPVLSRSSDRPLRLQDLCAQINRLLPTAFRPSRTAFDRGFRIDIRVTRASGRGWRGLREYLVTWRCRIARWRLIDRQCL